MVYLYSTLEMNKYRTGDRPVDARGEGEARGAALKGHQRVPGGGGLRPPGGHHDGTVQTGMLL